jgi:transposase InsO family protein
VAESFFAGLEAKPIMNWTCGTREDAMRAIIFPIETWYNRERRHSALHYVSPAA